MFQMEEHGYLSPLFAQQNFGMNWCTYKLCVYAVSGFQQSTHTMTSEDLWEKCLVTQWPHKWQLWGLIANLWIGNQTWRIENPWEFSLILLFVDDFHFEMPFCSGFPTSMTGGYPFSLGMLRMPFSSVFVARAYALLSPHTCGQWLCRYSHCHSRGQMLQAQGQVKGESWGLAFDTGGFRVKDVIYIICLYIYTYVYI